MNTIFNTIIRAGALVLITLLLTAMEVVAQDAQVATEEMVDPDAFPQSTEAPGNPFRDGTHGTWRVKRSYVLQVDRVQTRTSTTTDNVNIRTDGAYLIFHPFWNLPDSQVNSFWRIMNKDKWTFTTQVNHYNPFGGFILETVNPLGIHSSSLYGFNNTLPIGVSANARYREIGVDSFEDYMYGRCANKHFSFQNTHGIESKVTTRASHTGRYSLKVAPKEILSMEKNFAPCEEDVRPNIR